MLLCATSRTWNLILESLKITTLIRTLDISLTVTWNEAGGNASSKEAVIIQVMMGFELKK